MVRRHVNIVEKKVADFTRAGLQAHHGDPVLDQSSQMCGAYMEKGGDDTIHPALFYRLQAAKLVGGNAVGIIDDYFVAMTLRHILQTPYEGGIEGVRDRGNNAGNGMRLAGAQGARGAFPRPLRSTFVFMALTTVIGSFLVIDLICIMTSGGPANATQVVAYWAYDNAVYLHNGRCASAIALALALILSVGIGAFVYIRTKGWDVVSTTHR
jgi:hypothetical protein